MGQPPQRVAPRAHPLLAPGSLVRAAPGHADVLPGRPAVRPTTRSSTPSATRGCAQRHGQRASPWSARRRTGRWPTSSTSCSVAAPRRRSRNRTDAGDAIADRRPYCRDRPSVGGRAGRRSRRRAHLRRACSTAPASRSPTRSWRPGSTTRRRSRAARRTMTGRGRGRPAAPFVAVHLFARGLLRHLTTRIYLEAPVDDPVWERPGRSTDDAARERDRRRLPVRHPYPGHPPARETVFFDV